MMRTPRTTPSFPKVAKATALLWGLALACMMAITAWSGQWATRGDTLQMPFTYAFAVGPALSFFLVYRATASWRVWTAAAALAATVVVVGVVQIVLEYSGHYLLKAYLITDISPVIYEADVIARVLFIYIALDAFNAAVVWLLASQEQAREQDRLAAQARIEVAEARAAALASELRALRLRLDPHFIFNSLNSVASLIATGRPDQAEAMVMKLSEFLRGVLGGAAARVALSDELGAAADYVEVERVRFGSRLELDVDCPDDLHDALVPDFILQPLIENSVKHGLASGAALRVRVSARSEGDALRLTVEDDGSGSEAALKLHGFGLGQSTTGQRLASLYGGSASLEATRSPAGYRVELTLPLEYGAGDQDPRPRP